MNLSTYMPVRLYTGRDCLIKHGSDMARLGKRALIMTGEHSAKACGALDDCLQALDKEAISYKIFDKVSQNPKLTDCMQAADIAIESGAEFIIGIGGGSPIDSAKCTAVLSANPGMTQEKLYAFDWKNKPLPIVAIGTTAGTGTEVTKVSVITTPQGRKKSFHHDLVYPAISYGDYKYTLSLSDYFTRSTGIDAFAHCFESFFSRKATDLSQNYAVRGMILLKEVFDKIIESGTESLTEKDRDQLYTASLYGGFAINDTGTCLPHTMGYLLSEEYNVPHGIACAIFMQAFYDHNANVAPELTGEFHHRTGISEAALRNMLKDMIPEQNISMTEDDIMKAHDRWVNNGSIMKSQGVISPEMADDILRKLFVKND